MIAEFLRRVWVFIKEIVMFGIDAFMIAAAREIGKRFLERLKSRGGAAGYLDDAQKKQVPAYATGDGGQRRIPFLDEYRD